MNNDLTDINYKIIQPHDLNIELKEHQKTIIHRMNELETKGEIYTNDLYNYNESSKKYIIKTNMGILSDNSGAGKRLSIIGLILYKKKLEKKNNYIEGSLYMCIKNNKKNLISDKINLIISSKSNLYKWENEIKHAFNINYIIIKNTKDIQSFIKQKIKNIDLIIIDDINFNLFNKKIPNFEWGRIIIDYPETIKLLKCFFDCSFLWFITSSPYNLLYSKKQYLLNIFKNIMPNAFKHLIIKNDKEYLEKSIRLPKVNKINILCSVPEKISDKLYLKNIINCQDIEKTIKNLNLYIESKNNIFNNIFVDLKKKKYSCDRICNIKDNINKNNLCPICFEKNKIKCLITCCYNCICAECLFKSIKQKKNCPFCREIIKRDYIKIFKNNLNFKINKNIKNRIGSLIDILKQKKKKKIIIFMNDLKNNDFKKIMNINIIKNGFFKIFVIKNKRYIKDMLFNYNLNDNVIIFINSYKYNLCLKNINDIIFYNTCNKIIENKIINIAQRIGRKNSLNTYYLNYNL